MSYVLQEAGADLAQVRLLFVVFFLQRFDKFLLEAIKFVDVAEDGPELLLCEHVSPFTALFNVALTNQGENTVISRHNVICNL